MSDEITADTSASDLRKMYEKAVEKLRETEKSLTAYQAKERTTSVAEILKAKGAPAAAAKFYDGEVSEGAVASWLEENKELFPTSTAAPAANQSQTATAVDPNINAARVVTSATADSGDIEPVRDGSGRVLGDPAELMALLRSAPRDAAGYQRLVQAGLMPADPNRI